MIPPCVAIASHGSYIGVEASPQALWSRPRVGVGVGAGRPSAQTGWRLGQFGVGSEPHGRVRGVDRDLGVADHDVFDGVVGTADLYIGADRRNGGVVHLHRVVDVVV